jgi:hypothetical protein
MPSQYCIHGCQGSVPVCLPPDDAGACYPGLTLGPCGSLDAGCGGVPPAPAPFCGSTSQSQCPGTAPTGRDIYCLCS